MYYSYSDFRKTYAYLLKKYKDADNLYTDDREKFTGETIGTCVITHYKKHGSSWTVTEETTEEITRYNYCNIFDASPFFTAIGGSERATKLYTRYGLLPMKVYSISPDREFKTERSVKFYR